MRIGYQLWMISSPASTIGKLLENWNYGRSVFFEATPMVALLFLLCVVIILANIPGMIASLAEVRRTPRSRGRQS